MHPGKELVDELEALESTDFPTIELSFEQWRHVTAYVRVLEKYSDEMFKWANQAEMTIVDLRAELEGWNK